MVFKLSLSGKKSIGMNVFITCLLIYFCSRVIVKLKDFMPV